MSRAREKLAIITVNRDRLVVKATNFVRREKDVGELFRGGATELMNQLVVGVGEVAEHSDPNH